MHQTGRREVLGTAKLYPDEESAAPGTVRTQRREALLVTTWATRSTIRSYTTRRDLTLRGARILVLGLSYKADIDDDRESPSYEIIELLRERGADVACCVPISP